MKVDTVAALNARIESAFTTASRATGADFRYLLKTAMRESSLDAKARAATSSATGMFQFIESTWLEMVKREGTRFGLDEEAAAISRDGRGRYRVDDAEMRRRILALRTDPEISAKMAGAYAEHNARVLKQRLGREPNGGELYIAHFLGASGAARLILEAMSRPEDPADASFPSQARGNPGIFYNRDGSQRTVAEVYDVLVRQHDVTTMIADSQAREGADAGDAGDAGDIGGAGAAPPAMLTSFSAISGYRARNPAYVFDAFFRNDGTISPVGAVSLDYWVAARSESVGGGDVAMSERKPEEGARPAGRNVSPDRPGAIMRIAAVGDPLDLLQYVRREDGRPRDLLPPV